MTVRLGARCDCRPIDKAAPVGREQDALFAASLPQPPDDLKGGVRLARAGRHDQQHSVLPIGYGLDRRVDDLVVAWGLSAAVVEVVLKDDCLAFGRQPLPRAISRPQLGGRREGVERKVDLTRNAGTGAIVEHEAITVRGKHEGDVQRFGVVDRLLHPIADAMRVVFRLDDRDRDVGLVVEDVIGALGFTARHKLAAYDDAALREAHLLADLQHLVPTDRTEGGRDELGADIAFGEAAHVHASPSKATRHEKKLEMGRNPKERKFRWAACAW
jgi:hypothetical protein